MSQTFSHDMIESNGFTPAVPPLVATLGLREQNSEAIPVALPVGVEPTSITLEP